MNTLSAPDLPADPREFFSEIHVVDLPMVTRFRGITARQACLLRGPAGWAEFSPFPEYAPAEAHRWLAAAVEFAGDPHVHEAPPASSSSRPDSGARVPVNGTVPAVEAQAVPAVLERFPGVEVFKIKIAEHGAGSRDEDIVRIRAVLTSAPRARIRLDANGKLSLDEALEHIRACAELPGFLERLEYIEQPVAAVEDMARLREELHRTGSDLSGVRIAADENIRRSDDPLRVAEIGAADHIVVKAQPLGGVKAAAATVEACGLPATVSSALETSIGLAAGAQLALALGRDSRPWAAGLGTAALLAGDVVDSPRTPEHGTISADAWSPNPDLLRKHRAAPDVEVWWMRRLEACWEILRSPAQ